jgi:hypothetical protein
MVAMHVFMSYSRHDNVFVSRLVGVIERAGHDVWLDTSDIRGSEEWRQSIVSAIRAADVVVLVISPPSMASASVAREVTVAAEEKRRIVPVVLERAELTGSIRYELAGVQHILFEGQPFEEASARLLEALPTSPSQPARPAMDEPRAVAGGPSGASPRSTPATHGLESTARSARRGRGVGIGLLLLGIMAIGLVLFRGGLVSSGAPGATGAASAHPGGGATASIPDGSLRPAAGANEVTLDSKVWFAGYDIGVHGARFDDKANRVFVNVAFTNRQPANANPVNILIDDITALEWNGRRFTPFCQCNSLPPAATLGVTLTFDVDHAFSLADAVLTFGGPTQHQAKVPLGGGPATSERPVHYDVTGVIKDGAGSTFTLQSVDVLPSNCFGLADRLSYVPGPADTMSVIVWLTARTTAKYGVNVGDAYLVVPGGTKIGSASLTSSVLAVYPGRPVRDVATCMMVPAPTAGRYTFVVTANGVTPKPKGLKFDLR